MHVPVSWRERSALLLLPILAYGASLTFGFVDWDDPILVTQNPWVQGLTWANVRHAFTSYDPELYVPLTTLSYQLNFAVAGLQPWIYHATNLALHVCNVFLAAAAMRHVAPRRAAFIAALLFAVHPLHTEAVVWAASRKDLLSTAFLLGSLLAWLRWTAGGSRTAYAGAWVLFLFALASKVSVLPLALLLPFMASGDTPRWSARRAAAALPFLALAGVFAAVAAFGKETAGHFYLEQALLGAYATVSLLWKLLVPLRLAVLYPYTQPLTLAEPAILWSVLAVTALTVIAAALAKRSRWLPFAWAWFLLFLAPSFGNFAKGHDELLDLYVTTDRYAYVASLAPLLLAGWFLARPRPLLPKLTAALVVAALLLSVRQTLTWKTPETLWRHTLKVSPNSHVAHTNLGVILVQGGDLDGGRRAFAASLAVRPNSLAYYNLGLFLEHDGRDDDALASYRKSVEQSPLNVDAWLRILALLEKRGDTAGGQAALLEALTANPASEELLNW